MMGSGSPVVVRKRGRPRANLPLRSSVSTWVTQQEHDRLCQIAIRHGESVSSLLRRVIVLSIGQRPTP